MDKWTMRRLSAWDALMALRSARKDCENGWEWSLWSNASLLSRAIYCGRRRVFSDGTDVLRRLPPETVACWAAAYAALCAKPKDAFDGWQVRKELLAGDPIGRLRWTVGRRLGLSPREAVKMTDAALRDCALELMIDSEQELQSLCPSCREAAQTAHCPICGGASFEVNTAFDERRFEELKKHGLSDADA